MPKFSVLNLADKKLELAIEPWADLLILAPNECANFEYDEPAEVQFCLMAGGGGLVSVMGDRLKYSANGREEIWEDKTHFLSSHVTLKKE